MGKFMKSIESFFFQDGCSLEIYQDENPENPREWDNLGVMVCFHKRYDLGDRHDYKKEDYNGWDELGEQIIKDNPECTIMPLYLYDHSGLVISTGRFSCPWDSGQIGFIFITKERRIEQLKDDLYRAEEVLSAEVETYNQYLRGDIYRFILRDKPCEKCGGPGEILDNCGGFYGNNVINNGITDNLKEEYREELKCPKKSNI